MKILSLYVHSVSWHDKNKKTTISFTTVAKIKTIIAGNINSRVILDIFMFAPTVPNKIED